MSHLDLAPIGNCAVASLIDERARHVWFGFPRLDSDPMFNALLNGENPSAGFMDIVVDGFESSRQSYIRNTPILETVLRSFASRISRPGSGSSGESTGRRCWCAVSSP
jgi:hypothetical protein